MTVDHVTYEVLESDLNDPDLAAFMFLLGFAEIEPDAKIEKNWKVRWFIDSVGFTIHFVAGSRRHIGLGHFCIHRVGTNKFGKLRKSHRCTRDSGSGRIWMDGPAGIRVEVRP
jgi:hypothetical protein